VSWDKQKTAGCGGPKGLCSAVVPLMGSLMANKSVAVQQRSNPQPYGFFNDPSRQCMRTPPIIQRYVAKISERTVEVLVQRLLRGFDLSPEIALTVHAAEVRLRIAKPAMNRLVETLPFLGHGVTPHIYPHQPYPRAAADHLTSLTYHQNTSVTRGTRVAHGIAPSDSIVRS